MNKEIFVYIDLNGAPILVGHLWSRVRNGRESASFEYDSHWLKFQDRFSLEPALMLAPGPYHAPQDKPLFGALGDSAPDRWGRMLIRRAERRSAEKEGRTPRTLWEIDYLLKVNDETRPGALRFKDQEKGPFLAENRAMRVPPLLKLPKLLAATERLGSDEETDADLKLLLAPGSSLGGARPKASVLDKDNQLAIAKFSQKSDEYNVVLWEALALSLASAANIEVPKHRIEYVLNKPVLLLQRFDRMGNNRIPFLSAMSMLGARDNEMHSYLEIVDALRQQGEKSTQDIMALWRRIIFNIMISNTDDHLRNHGFLYGGSGWRLSPAYDLNPIPLDIRPRVLSTAVDIDDATGTIELAMSVIDYFGLSLKQAKDIVAEVRSAVSMWRQKAKQLGILNHEIERMASAFELYFES